MTRRVRPALRSVMTTIIAGGFGALAVVVLLAGPLSNQPNALLTSGPNFTIHGVICASQNTPCTTPALLYPGVTRYMWYTVTNGLNAPISVQTLTLSVDVTTAPTPPAGCDPTKITGGSYSVSSQPTFTVGSNSTSQAPVGVPVTLADSGNQSACTGVTFHFNFAGTARYTDSTSTSLVSSAPGGSNLGQQVTYTATVTPAVNPAPAPVAGSVTFYDSSTPITCTSPTFTSTTSGDTATCAVTYTTPGTHSITAVFTPSDSTNFSASTSNIVTQVVNPKQQIGNCSGSVAGATVLTGTYGNYEVKNGQTVWLDGGTVKGNVQVDATGQFTATNSTITGNVQSAGGPVSLLGTSVGGNVQGTNATIGIGPGSSVGGNVQTSGGAAECMQGTSGKPVQVTGNVQVQSLPVSSTLSTICVLNIGGNLQIQSNGSPIQVGGSSSCTGNTVAGNLQVQNNTATVTIGGTGAGFGNTTTKGNIQVQGNTGGGTLTNNSAGNNCQLSGDSPKITGSGNSAKGTNSCNGAG